MHCILCEDWSCSRILIRQSKGKEREKKSEDFFFFSRPLPIMYKRSTCFEKQVSGCWHRRVADIVPRIDSVFQDHIVYLPPASVWNGLAFEAKLPFVTHKRFVTNPLPLRNSVASSGLKKAFKCQPLLIKKESFYNGKAVIFMFVRGKQQHLRDHSSVLHAKRNLCLYEKWHSQQIRIF